MLCLCLCTFDRHASTGRLHSYRFVDVADGIDSHVSSSYSTVNATEARVVGRIVDALVLVHGVAPSSIGVIAMYTAQV